MLAADQRQKTIEGQYVRNLLTGEPFAKFVAGQVNVLANVMFHS